MRQLLKKIVHPFLKKWYKFYLKKPKTYSKYGISLTIFPSVFHPGIFLSTNIFIEFIQKLDFDRKKVLELGAGSGMISFYAAKYKNAIVTASDNNPNAIKGLNINRKKTGIPVNVIPSNLFENISPSEYDFILINPPYYPKTPRNEEELAFYCGENFEYFESLFLGLTKKVNLALCEIYIILSEDCEIEKIKNLATKQIIDFEQVHFEKKMGECNYIFRLRSLK